MQSAENAVDAIPMVLQFFQLAIKYNLKGIAVVGCFMWVRELISHSEGRECNKGV